MMRDYENLRLLYSEMPFTCEQGSGFQVISVLVGAKFFSLLSFSHSLDIVYLFLLFGILLITLLCYVLSVNLVIQFVVSPFAIYQSFSCLSVKQCQLQQIFSFSRFSTNPSYTQHLVSGFIFIVFFNFILQWPLGSLSVLQLLFFRSCRNLLFLTLQ